MNPAMVFLLMFIKSKNFTYSFTYNTAAFVFLFVLINAVFNAIFYSAAQAQIKNKHSILKTSPLTMDLNLITDIPFYNDPLILDNEKFQEAEFDNGFEYSSSRSWRSPTYTRNAEFNIPEKLSSIVQFWVDIYSKYTTSQGVLHSMSDPTRIYEVIDFSDIDDDPNQNPVRKELNRMRRVEIHKKSLAKALKKNQIKDDFRFQLGQADRMLTAIYYSGRYLEKIEDVFRAEGLPVELSRLPFVESSFNIFAYSKVGASGIWQVMPTSSNQSFVTRSSFDLRNHPILATKMATKVLKQGYKLTGSWPLAVMGYNHGPAAVNRRIKRAHTKEIGVLLTKHKKEFGFASRNFYPCFLAALEVEGHAKKYFSKVKWSKPLPSTPYLLSRDLKYSKLLSWFGGDHRMVQVYNPHLTSLLRKKGLKIPKGTPIEIPIKSFEKIQKELSTLATIN
jgi:membrane-bound lytic murein transglycosylase D